MKEEIRRNLLLQIVVFLAILIPAVYLINNVQLNLAKQNIATGFSFLSLEAGFDIGEGASDYSPSDSYAQALMVGLANTLKIAVIGNIFAVVIGIFVGVSTLSKNWGIAALARIYIELIRNIPLLLQLFFWYALFTEILPGVRQALSPVPGIFISNRGFVFPAPVQGTPYLMGIATFFVMLASMPILKKLAVKRLEKTGNPLPIFQIGLGMILGGPIVVWAIFGAPREFSWPTLGGFNFNGGMTLGPEFTALLLGLITYTAAFIAEIVRSGIQAVDKGQWEAARSLGLTNSQSLSLVVLPQALRVIIPPLTGQLLNLTKNSSLAVAIGFPDFVSVANTTMNQTGQAVEGVALIMMVYLTISLVTSGMMNFYNKKASIPER